jgi:hypothetical protein
MPEMGIAILDQVRYALMGIRQEAREFVLRLGENCYIPKSRWFNTIQQQPTKNSLTVAVQSTLQNSKHPSSSP